MPLPQAILCIDIDGTLIDSHERIHPQDVQVLKNFPEEIQPMLTTGRILHSAKGVLRENGLFKPDPFPLPGVFMNGGVTYQPGETLCTHHAFLSETREALINLSGNFPRSAFTFFAIDTVYLVNSTSFAHQIARIHHLGARSIDADDLPAEIIKVMILEPEPTAMQKIKHQSQSLEAEKAFSLPFAFEINPPGIDKAVSLTALLKSMHLDGLPIYAAGDAENDLALFKHARTSFAPTTAHPKVIKVADHLIARENEGLLTPLLRNLSLENNN
jgi:Cof subfamily protein (haloacid dehalogenase superfamily)